MSCHHVGAEISTEALGQKYGMDKDGGLCYFCLFEIFRCAFEHQVGDAEAEDFVCFFKEFAGFGVVVVEVFAHAYELGALPGENVCFHSFLN